MAVTQQAPGPADGKCQIADVSQAERFRKTHQVDVPVKQDNDDDYFFHLISMSLIIIRFNLSLIMSRFSRASKGPFPLTYPLEGGEHLFFKFKSNSVLYMSFQPGNSPVSVGEITLFKMPGGMYPAGNFQSIRVVVLTEVNTERLPFIHAAAHFIGPVTAFKPYKFTGFVEAENVALAVSGSMGSLVMYS